ncbi:MAG: ankyrin repeat domain-containing protein, partial [Alphaproteobacteria bacterium]|nr:ankyrin repeat domain-containing protein [Alphaproteobacteria bacterium]
MVTPFFIAAKNGHEDVVKALITAGANNYITDKSIRTPLFDTTVSGHSKEGESIKSYPLFGLFCALSVCGIITYLEKSGRRQTELLERSPIGELSETQIKRILESNLEDLTCPITYDTLDELTSIVAVGNHQNSLYSKAELSNWLVG